MCSLSRHALYLGVLWRKRTIRATLESHLWRLLTSKRTRLVQQYSSIWTSHLLFFHLDYTRKSTRTRLEKSWIILSRNAFYLTIQVEIEYWRATFLFGYQQWNRHCIARIEHYPLATIFFFCLCFCCWCTNLEIRTCLCSMRTGVIGWWRPHSPVNGCSACFWRPVNGATLQIWQIYLIFYLASPLER